ncbi:MAG: GcrA family cell cycle regulator [Pelagibacteraceae bacterium]
MSWTEEKVQKLRELWTKGHTASEIASMLGDTTRNAVIGKAHRLNLEERAPSKSKSVHTEKKEADSNQPKLRGSASRKSKFKSILLDKDFEPEKPTNLENLTDETCKWPIGHPDEENFYFCGRKPVDAFPYCKLHVLYAFQPKGQKEEILDEKDDEVPPFIEKKIKSA